jgi:DNA-binding NarL/FixJ family response regulator
MTCNKPIQIILADDHELFRRGFRRILQEQTKQFEFIDEACEGAELVEKVLKYRPDLVITDVRMRGLDGVQACKIIKERTNTPVIGLSAFDEDQLVLEMIQAGASGLISKNASVEEVNEAILTVHGGSSFYCSTIGSKLYGALQTDRRKPKPIDFTMQELKIVKLLCKQFTSREIASALNLNVRTVEDYRHRLQDKTGSRNVVGIILFCIFNNIVRQGEF